MITLRQISEANKDCVPYRRLAFVQVFDAAFKDGVVGPHCWLCYTAEENLLPHSVFYDYRELDLAHGVERGVLYVQKTLRGENDD